MRNLGIAKVVPLAFEDALVRVRAALGDEGFGVLTEIDVRETLRAKLGVERPPYHILGACNPPFAHRVLGIDPEMGLLLPCNVLVYVDDLGRTRVSAVDPVELMRNEKDVTIQEIAAEIRTKLDRVVASLPS